MPSSQKDLIGDHPAAPNEFNRWLNCTDVALVPGKCHRSLVGAIAPDNQLIEWLAKRLIHHHYEETRLKRLQEKYKEAGFPLYAEQHRRLPRADKTMKGNLTEMLLIEYVEGCQKKTLIKVLKLRYNPNVDQAIKGDDTLMVDIIKDGKKEKVKIFLGEAKFRKKPSKTVVDTIAKSLAKSKKPISYSYLVNEMLRDEKTKAIGDILDKYIVDEIKGKGDIVYTGFLLSDNDTFNVVESNLTSDNPALVFISTSIDNPNDLVAKAFQKAEELLKTPDKL